MSGIRLADEVSKDRVAKIFLDYHAALAIKIEYLSNRQTTGEKKLCDIKISLLDGIERFGINTGDCCFAFPVNAKILARRGVGG